MDKSLQKSSINKEIKEKLINSGMTIMNNKSTRTIESKPTCLDFIMTNRPQKITNVEQIYGSYSDHSVLIMNRKNENR